MKVCIVEGCEGKHFTKNYCRSHHARFMRYGDPLKGGAYRDRTHDDECTIEGCEGNHFAKGYCTKHYKRLYRHGDAIEITRTGNNEHDGKCSIEGCVGKYKDKGYCHKHWKRSDTGVASNKAHKHKRRSLTLNAIVNDLTSKDWRKSLKHFNNECAYCGCADNKIHADHVVPLSKGGTNTITNIIPACPSCNQRKNAKLIEKWYPKQPFYSKQRETKIYKWIGYKVHSNVLQATLF